MYIFNLARFVETLSSELFHKLVIYVFIGMSFIERKWILSVENGRDINAVQIFF
jgi:hypothetical protein